MTQTTCDRCGALDSAKRKIRSVNIETYKDMRDGSWDQEAALVPGKDLCKECRFDLRILILKFMKVEKQK